MANLNENEVVLGSVGSNPILDGVKQKNAKKRYGLQFPFTNTNNGYFSKMSDVDVVRSNLLQLIKTEPGERIMNPEFGCPLKSLLFSPITPELTLEVKQRISQSIKQFLPTVRLLSIKVFLLDEYKSNGLPTIKIVMVCKLLDRVDSIFEVRTTI